MNEQVPQPVRHQWRGFLEFLTMKRAGQAVTVQFVSAQRDSRPGDDELVGELLHGVRLTPVVQILA